MSVATTSLGMRELAALASTEECVDPWCAEVLDARPLVVLTAVGQWDTRMGLMDAGPGTHTVFGAVVEPTTAASGSEFLWADTLGKSKLLDMICTDVNWLVREATGAVPREP